VSHICLENYHDICTFGSILLHLRDPFLALQRVTSHVKETAIVTDVFRGRIYLAELILGCRLIRFIPNAKSLSPVETWWKLTPKLVSEFLQILGFVHTKISFHWQIAQDKKGRYKKILLFTVVGHRKKPVT